MALLLERVLIGLGLLLGYALLVTVKPKKRCGRCRGFGSKQRRRRSRTACAKCGATGRQFMPGARLVHKGIVLAVDSIREHAEHRREAGE